MAAVDAFARREILAGSDQRRARNLFQLSDENTEPFDLRPCVRQIFAQMEKAPNEL